MEKDVKESPPQVERRLSYCEVNANPSDNLRLGAGSPDEILSLLDEVTNVRFFMLEPLEGVWLRARWYRGKSMTLESSRPIPLPTQARTQARGAASSCRLCR